MVLVTILEAVFMVSLERDWDKVDVYDLDGNKFTAKT